MRYPPAIQKLVEELIRLPGIGPRSAERIVFHLLKSPPDETVRLAGALTELRKKIHHCSSCFNVAQSDPCPICADVRRDQHTLCVVERPTDVVAVERAGNYRGRYHVLMGKIAPLDGVGPEALRIRELIGRVKRGGIGEVIIATGSDVEGEATALYVAKTLKELPVRVTRIAHGIPMGSSLDFSDEVTISKAFQGRTPV
ncbi:MAG: recombination mediator RecR [Candidatus Aureabacteria bacterium]|nr:recombination mediator RecR [Candidatus Auribacterota bacterium]